MVPLTYLEISVIAGRSNRLFKKDANSLLISLASGGKSALHDLEGEELALDAWPSFFCDSSISLVLSGLSFEENPAFPF